MKKKRFSKVLFLLPVIMVALLLSSFTTVASAAEATADDIPLLRVENELAQAGETVVIEVKTENNPGILNALLTLSFDDELTLIDIQEGDALSKLDFTPPGKNSEGTYYSPCNFLWDAIDDADSTNGTILKLTFLLPEDAVPGTIYDIELSYVSGDIADGNLDPIEFDIINGYVEVLDYTPGDVNGDGRFNGTDITLLRRYITGGYGVSIDARAADVNDDGRINGTDVTLIRRFITGGYGVELKPSHGCFNHTVVIDPAVAATCTTTGLTEGKHCSVCHVVIIAQQNTDKLGHLMSKTEAKDADCTEDGNIAYWTCIRCNKYYSDVNGNTEIAISDTVISATGHDFSDIWDWDNTHHWRPSTCEHTEVKDKYSVHNILSNGSCSTPGCGYIDYIQLETPVITNVEYDIVYWEPVANASKYKVFVNGDYSYTTQNHLTTSVDIKEAKNAYGEKLSIAGNVSIRIQALGAENGRYTESDFSDEKTYYFISELVDQDKYDHLESKQMGKGYNLIEDEYLNAPEKASQNPVFNLKKLMTLGKYNTPIPDSKGVSVSYSFSSIDELISSEMMSLGYEGKVGYAPVATFKVGVSGEIESKYRNYKYAETFILYGSVKAEKLEFKLMDRKLLENCLDDNFVRLVKSYLTPGVTNYNELFDILYSEYGTHALAGLLTGGQYVIQYTVFTNEYEVAQSVELAFSTALSLGDFNQLLGANFNFDIAGTSDIISKHQDTECILTGYYIGGKGGLIGGKSISEASSAMNAWSSSVDSQNSVALSFTENGAIPISELLGYIEPGLGKAYEDYINARADDLYHELYDQFSYKGDAEKLDVQVDDDNVLTIKLEDYQFSGSLGEAYHANLFDGVFTVYPKMMGKRIDKIVINGAFDQYNKLIDGFTLRFDDSWQGRDNVIVVVDNLGVKAAAKEGFIDTTHFNNITVEYSKLNVIQLKKLKEGTDDELVDGVLEYHGSIDGKTYSFVLSKESEFGSFDVDCTKMLVSDKLYLPIAKLEGYDFIGWYDGNDNEVADAYGVYKNTYDPATAVPTIYAKFEAHQVKVKLDHKEATQYDGDGYFYIRYHEGAYDNDGELSNRPLTPLPQRTGYVFKGYYYTNSNGHKVQFVDEKGMITAEADDILFPTSIVEITVVVEWEKARILVALNNSLETITAPSHSQFFVKYKEGIYQDKDCTSSLSKITPPSAENYSFGGYYTQPNGQGVLVVSASGEIIAASCLNFATATDIFAYWTPIHTIELSLGEKGEVSYGNSPKYMYVESGVGVYADNKGTTPFVNNSMVVPNRTGYAFKGYFSEPVGKGIQYVDGNGAIDVSQCIALKNNASLYAYWIPCEYTVEFDVDTNSALENVISPEAITVTYDASYGNLPDINVDHWIFEGWFTSSEFKETQKITSDSTVETANNHTLYAKWKQKEYAITFNCNGTSTTIYVLAESDATIDEEFYKVANFVSNDVLFAGWDKDISNVTTSMTVNALYLNGTTQKATVSESLSISITPQTDKIVLNASTSNLTYSASVMGTGSNGMPSVTTHTASATAYIVVKQNGTTLARATSFDMKEISVVSGQTVTITLELSNSYSGSTPISASYSGNLIYTAMYNVSADRMVTNAALNTKTGSPAVSTSTTVSITPTSNKIIIVSANTSNLGYSISGLDTSGGWPQSVTYTASSVAAIIVVRQNGVEIARGTSLNSLELYVESGKEITITLELSHSSVPSVDMNPVETYSGSFNYTIMY